jgi:hypothetical protein
LTRWRRSASISGLRWCARPPDPDGRSHPPQPAGHRPAPRQCARMFARIYSSAQRHFRIGSSRLPVREDPIIRPLPRGGEDQERSVPHMRTGRRGPDDALLANSGRAGAWATSSVSTVMIRSQVKRMSVCWVSSGGRRTRSPGRPSVSVAKPPGDSHSRATLIKTREDTCLRRSSGENPELGVPARAGTCGHVNGAGLASRHGRGRGPVTRCARSCLARSTLDPP